MSQPIQPENNDSKQMLNDEEVSAVFGKLAESLSSRDGNPTFYEEVYRRADAIGKRADTQRLTDANKLDTHFDL